MRKQTRSEGEAMSAVLRTHELATTSPQRPSEIYHKQRTDPSSLPTVADRVLIMVFLSAITLPLFGLVMRLDTGLTLDENRVLASMPAVNLKRATLAKLPAKFERYFNDRFGFRQRLIQWLNFVKVAGLGVSPSPRVVLGRDRWLFYGDVEVPYYRALNELTSRELEQWQHVFEDRRDWLAARGVPYLIVFAPNKSTIYADHMPRSYNPVHTQSRLGQLMDHLKSHTNLNVIDLSAPLLAAKTREQVYYRTDSHWNQRGAYIGYSRTIEALSAWFPQLKAVPRAEFREIKYVEPGRDLAIMLGLRPYFAEEYFDVETPKPRLARTVPQSEEVAKSPGRLSTSGADIVYESPGKELPRAVMFRDSFATSLIPFLVDHFQRITFSWQYTFDRELVAKEHPDVVIQEMVERTLMAPPDVFLTR